jgi:hypothetical protein
MDIGWFHNVSFPSPPEIESPLLLGERLRRKRMQEVEERKNYCGEECYSSYLALGTGRSR